MKFSGDGTSFDLITYGTFLKSLQDYYERNQSDERESDEEDNTEARRKVGIRVV